MDWRAMYTFAVNERIAGLIWHRSASCIRTMSPPEVSDTWRSFAVTCRLHGERQLSILSELVETLDRADALPVVLKGLPLSTRLYGDFSIRSAGDFDVYVPLAARTDARLALARTGWNNVGGAPPWTETFMAIRDGREVFLELHSSLVDENLLHLRPRAPRSIRMRIEDREFPVFEDPLLPGYLAAHASKHMPPALLYFFDFRELWSGLNATARAEAEADARAAGLARYLTWMLRRADALDDAASGDRNSLGLLGITAMGRHGTHAVFRDIALAPTLRAAAQGLAAWVWPSPIRKDKRAFARLCLHRLRTPWQRYISPKTPSRIPAGQPDDPGGTS
jgi:hypothetical protein